MCLKIAKESHTLDPGVEQETRCAFVLVQVELPRVSKPSGQGGVVNVMVGQQLAIVNSLQVSGTIENVRNVQVNSFQPDIGSYVAFIGILQFNLPQSFLQFNAFILFDLGLQNGQ